MHDYHWLFYDDVALQRQNRERAQLRPFSFLCTNPAQVTIIDVSIRSEVSNLENVKTYKYTNATIHIHGNIDENKIKKATIEFLKRIEKEKRPS